MAIFGIVSIISGLILSICGLPNIGARLVELYYLRVLGWRVVEGSIQTSTVIPEKTEYGTYININEPNIKYHYEVGGKNYVGKDSRIYNGMLINWQDTYRTKQDAFQDYVSRYYEGKPVEVWYDPKYPKDSTIRSWKNAEGCVTSLFYNFIFWAAGAGLIYLGVSLLD